MPKHSHIAQDVMAHFALRGARVGTAFEKNGFLRLAFARAPISQEVLAAAMAELVDEGFVVESGRDHFLTHKGHEHIYGRKDRDDDARPDDREQQGD